MNPSKNSLEELKNDYIAQSKFNDFKSKDPFPDILPSLLNSADIHDYIITTGMICPYDPEKRLKSASYVIRFNESEVIYWDENNKKQVIDFSENDFFILKKNSIVYVSIKTKFRLPDYIALRFNLTISLVHKGLLLGTGPLVDPGFEGNLLVPLHNLTANDYKLMKDEGFIWIEFTKISNNIRWENNSNSERKGIYEPFPENKKNKFNNYYIHKALNDSTSFDSIRSSIPGEVQKAINIATESKNRINKIAWVGGLTTILVIIVTFIFGISPIVSLVQDANNYVKNERTEVRKEIEELKLFKKELEKLINDAKEKNLLKKIPEQKTLDEVSEDKDKQTSQIKSDIKTPANKIIPLNEPNTTK